MFVLATRSEIAFHLRKEAQYYCAVYIASGPVAPRAMLGLIVPRLRDAHFSAWRRVSARRRK
jgi:hypothetical protein